MLQTALNALAALTVSGVQHNYGIDALPQALARGNLPVLLVLPLEPDTIADDGLFADRAAAFEAVAFSDGVKTVTYAVTHLLLEAPFRAGRGLRDHLPGLVTRIDAYFAALSNAVTLGGVLREPATVRIDPGVYNFNGVEYVGCAFRHRWVVAL
jgi:hypothetical protein